VARRAPMLYHRHSGELFNDGRGRLRFDGAPLSEIPPAPVVGGGDEWRAAVWKLLDNAVKYSPADQVRILVRLERDPEGRVAVRVTDHGVGIAATDLKRIFRRFYRVPSGVSVRAKGSGLGLFIVRTVARKHGGRAFAESQGAGRGSTFTLLLPRAARA